MLQRLFADADYEHLLKCWTYLDNHDVVRITDAIGPRRPRTRHRAAVHAPGAVNLYYGSNRPDRRYRPGQPGPDTLDLVGDDNPTLALHRRLIDLRRRTRALRVGDLRWLVTDRLIGLERHTERIDDAVFVLANPSPEPVAETVLMPESKLMDIAGMDELFTGRHHRNYRGTLAIELGPWQVAVLTPTTAPIDGYTPAGAVVEPKPAG